MNNEYIKIRGAREHNLKNVDIDIPKNKFVVITGLSGSGKSSLAFDTIYAEGQRRYVESLSSYARQFLGIMDKPDVELIEGLSPAIAIDQKSTSNNPRSTVGTVTEIYDYLRLLYARVGLPYCPKCGKKIERQSIDQIVENVLTLPEGTKIQVLSPVIRGRKGEYQAQFAQMQKDGFSRVRVDGKVYELSEEIKLDKKKKHNIEIIVDRLVIKPEIESRLSDAIEISCKFAEGLVLIDIFANENVKEEERLFSQNYSCPDCGISIGELTPRMFSFNNPFGACPTCTGLGTMSKIDPDLIIPDKNKSLYDGITVMGWSTVKMNNIPKMYIKCICDHFGIDPLTPIKKVSKEFMDIVLYGTDELIDFIYETPSGNHKSKKPFEGVINTIERRYRETTSQSAREYYETYMVEMECPDCKGARLKKESLAVRVGGKNIDDVVSMSINKIKDFIANLKLNKKDEIIAEQVIKELNYRLDFLLNVGLDYLTLSRNAGTLSGGELQRIRLATQIGTGLTGVLYILDEPSIGLHQRDNEKLLNSLKHLRDLGNTVIVVEHDEDTMYAADYIIDLGLGAGVHGGNIIAKGSVEEIKANKESITGQYLSGKKKIDVPKKRRVENKKFLKVIGAKQNNLKNIDVDIPIGVLTCVTGVSGSGKSSLVNEIIYKALAKDLNGAKIIPGNYKKVEGLEYLDKVINIDQSPIGRTPRSNPATYTGTFDLIRDIFTMTNEAKTRGYKKGRFSFNVPGGRCESCKGDGILTIEMHFLSDVYVPCEVCKGKRYNKETLEVKYKGKSIADVLDMTIEEALEFFKNVPKIKNKLQTVYDVGLGYIKLGQSSTTLSGGEAQRVKLATELSKKATGKTLYILDEPSTGLHIDDVSKLVEILQKLVESGNTVVVIEHNLDIIKIADYIIDLGPDGGNAGGQIIANGLPEEIVKNKKSYTGKFLKKYLD